MGADLSKQRRLPSWRVGSNTDSILSRSSSWSVGCASWSTVAQFPLDVWKREGARSCGFDYSDEWRNCHFKVYKRPWSDFSVTKRQSDGKEERVCSFSLEVSETGRQEKISRWVKHLHVIAVHQRILVVQVILSKAVKLLVIDWHKDQLLGTYSFVFSKEPCIQECYISPDGNMMLCRQDFWLRRRLHHIASFDANIRVIEIKDGLCQRLFVIEDSLAFNLFGSGISFDPRYKNRRVALFASSVHSLSRGDDEERELQIFDLKTQKIITSSGGIGLDRVIHHIKHSHDGRIIAALLVNFSVLLAINMSLHATHLYDADSLKLLHVIILPNEPCSPNLATTFPMFSRDSTLLAQFSGDRSSEVWVYKLPWPASSLQDLCRRVIVQATPPRSLLRLPLPQRLLQFLCFSKEAL